MWLGTSENPTPKAQQADESKSKILKIERHHGDLGPFLLLEFDAIITCIYINSMVEVPDSL